MEPPVQSVPIGETSITHGMRDACEVEQRQTILQPSQPAVVPTISQGSHLDATSQAIQIDLPLLRLLSDCPQKGQMYLKRRE